MKELWTTNPFHLVNGPFAEMGYSSSSPNIVPVHLLLATRWPSAHHPLASGAASADASRCPHPLVRISHRHYGRRFAGVGAPYPLRTIRLLPAQHPSSALRATCRLATIRPPTHGATSVGSLHAICPPAHRAMPVDLATNHPPTHGTASAVSLQATCRRSAQQMVAPCKPFVDAPCTTICCPPRRSICRLSTHHPSASGAASADASRCPHPPAHKPPARTDTLSPCKNTLCTIVNCPLQIKPVFYFLFTSTAPPAHRIRVKSSLLRLGRSCLALPFTHLGKDIT